MAALFIKIMILFSLITIFPVSVSGIILANDLMSVNNLTYPLQGSFEMGMYVARVNIGTPPNDFSVAIDSGSNDLWVSSSICTGSPASLEIGLQGEPQFYDLANTTSGSQLSCEDKLCPHCSKKKQCTYSTNYYYGDGRAYGFYVKDIVHFGAMLPGSPDAKFSAQIAFGCTTRRSGTMSMAGVDGLFGLGPGPLSMISQLSSAGKIPKVFSHCLTGEGGGYLFLGEEPVHQDIAYTPMVPSDDHYFINMRSISVNKKVAPINPSAFTKSGEQSTVVDSGTKYAILVEEAYSPLVNMINAEVSESVTVEALGDKYCYLISNSVMYNLFPEIRLNFDGGASLNLRPRDYLEDSGTADGAVLSCFGFQSSRTAKLNVLGILVLKDKIVTYNLEKMRIGVSGYRNCSQPVEGTPQPASLSAIKPVPKMFNVLYLCIMTLIIML